MRKLSKLKSMFFFKDWGIFIINANEDFSAIESKIKNFIFLKK